MASAAHFAARAAAQETDSATVDAPLGDDLVSGPGGVPELDHQNASGAPKPSTELLEDRVRLVGEGGLASPSGWATCRAPSA
jgi:hypothetical protein